MNETTNLNIRMEKKIKQQAEELFAEFGINMTTAINMFLRQAIRQRGIPFDLTLDTPNAQTIAAMNEADEMLEKGTGKRFSSAKEMFEELEK